MIEIQSNFYRLEICNFKNILNLINVALIFDVII